MSCNEELTGSYTINKKTEFNKVIKAMVDAANETVDTINTLVKAYKGKTRNRKIVDWDLVEQCCPTKTVPCGGWSTKRVFAVDLNDWNIRQQITTAIKQRGKLPKVTKDTLRVEDMSINLVSQSFEIDVDYDNHTVDRWNEQPTVRAFWKALRKVNWQARGAKDGGYCQYNCEYQDEPNYQDYAGRVGKDMRDWVRNRPF